MKKLTFLFVILAAFACAPSLAHAAGNCIDATYTTFKETWNQPSGDPVWSGGSSVGCQTWTKTTGTTQAITAGSGCGSGWANTNVLELPTNATQNELQTIGTIPYVPVNTSSLGYDFYWEMCYSSSTWSNFFPVVALDYPGAATRSFYLETSNTTNAFYINGVTQITGFAANTRYLFHLNVVTNSTCTLSWSGGGTGSQGFTCAAADFNRVTLWGMTSTSNFYFGLVGLAVPSFPGGWPPSTLIDFNGATNGATPTATTLNTGTRCNAGGASYATWTVAAPATNEAITYSNTNAKNFANNLTVCSTSYAGNTGLSFHRSLNGSAVTSSGKIGYQVQTAYSGISWGFSLLVNTTVASSNFTDLGGLDGISFFHTCGSTGTTTCTGSQGSFTNLLICAEQTSGTTVGCAVISNNTFYWITKNSTPTGADSMSVYNVNSNGTAGSLVATFSLTDTAFASGDAVAFGAVGAEVPGTSLDEYVSNVIIDDADAVFPVLPPASSSGHCGACDISESVFPVDLRETLELANLL